MVKIYLSCIGYPNDPRGLVESGVEVRAAFYHIGVQGPFSVFGMQSSLIDSILPAASVTEVACSASDRESSNPVAEGQLK